MRRKIRFLAHRTIEFFLKHTSSKRTGETRMAGREHLSQKCEAVLAKNNAENKNFERFNRFHETATAQSSICPPRCYYLISTAFAPKISCCAMGLPIKRSGKIGGRALAALSLSSCSALKTISSAPS